MTIDVKNMIERTTSIAKATGKFGVVTRYEPKSPPPPGLNIAVFLSAIAPVARASGLAVTSARVELTARIYKPDQSRPEALTDVALAEATSAVVGAFTGGFTLGGTVMSVDLLGAHGRPLGATAGYWTVGNARYRIMDIVIPIIAADAWPQEA
jgi:hypothetical protein